MTIKIDICRFLLVISQTIEVNEIGEGQPLVKINLGEARIISGYKNLLHVIDLNEYVNCTNQFEDALRSLNAESDPTLIDAVNTLGAKLSQLREKLNSLLPFSRQKRGIKIITGNMDAGDERNIKTVLQKTEKNGRSLTDYISRERIPQEGT